jgi:hypothetical protein
MRTKLKDPTMSKHEDYVGDALAEAGVIPITSKRRKKNGYSDSVTVEDFYAHMATPHGYIFVPTRELWPAASVNARIPAISGGAKPVSASKWIDKNKPIEQMTWCPGLPLIVEDRLISEGGWIERRGAKCFNLYRPPAIRPGDPARAQQWLDHIAKVFPDDVQDIVNWCAQRVQHPEVKINHALVLGGDFGIGKDTLLEPVKRAIGPWNFAEVSPQHMLGRFNGFLRSVILRVNEARDLGEFDRFKFYDHMKSYIAAPPDVLLVDEKHLRAHSVVNCCGVTITTNHKTDGIYLPANDRRHFVAWSDLTMNDFSTDYWQRLWRYYDSGGDRHVAAYLASVDLSAFDPKAPPRKTPAFWDIVGSSQVPEDAELADVLDQMSNPDATTLIRITGTATGGFFDWITDRKNRRTIPHKMDRCGYVAVHNPDAKDGLWKISGKRQAIYARKDMTLNDRFRAASSLIKSRSTRP